MKATPSAYQKSLNLLNRKDYSEWELKKKLQTAEYDASEIQDALERLKELKFLCDERVAESMFRSYTHKGNYWIRERLKQRGIAEPIIDTALSESTSELERAKPVALKKWKQVRAKNDYERGQKLATFLAQRGFGLDVCWKTVDWVKSQSEEPLEE